MTKKTRPDISRQSPATNDARGYDTAPGAGDNAARPAVFKEFAPLYWERGLSVVPVPTGTKIPAMTGWAGFMGSLPGQQTREKLLARYGEDGIGILAGTVVLEEDGIKYCLGGIDGDRDDCVRVMDAIVGKSPSAKFGAKGKTSFVLYPKGMKIDYGLPRKNKDVGNMGRVFDVIKRLHVLPPSIHETTKRPYRWVGESLLECDLAALPRSTPHMMELLRVIAESENVPTLISGEYTNEAALSFSAQLVAAGASDEEIERIFRALLPADYEQRPTGDPDTLNELPGMVRRARQKGFTNAAAKKGPSVREQRLAATNWLLNDWLETSDKRWRDGLLLTYGDGWWRAHDERELMHAVMHDYEKSETLEHADGVAVVRTALDRAPRFEAQNDGHHLVCLLNGTFDMDTGERRDWSPDDMLISQLPFEHDPGARCPLYEAMLLRLFAKKRDQDDIPVDASEADIAQSINCLEEFVSMTLFECLEYQKLLMLLGESNTGKSVIIKMIKMFHQSDSYSAVAIQDFSKEQYRAAMVGKLLNISAEVAATSHAADDFLKAVTGADPVQVRFLYQPAQQITLPTRFFIACNEPFRTRDTSGAIEERLMILTCDNYVPKEERDKDLPRKLRAELPGIFNRMAAAWQRLRERGQFDPPASSGEEINKFAQENNHVIAWVKEQTHQGKRLEDPEYEMPDNLAPTVSDELFGHFKLWSQDRNYKPMSKDTWSKRLKAVGRVLGLDTASFVRTLPGHNNVRHHRLNLIGRI
jgi:P4 family phage/plasmid primase-like protien